MAVTKEKRKQIVSKFQAHSRDTGTSLVQIALTTEKIQNLSQHLKSHKKDYHSQFGLLKLVGKRRRLLNYLKRTEPRKYTRALQDLELRK